MKRILIKHVKCEDDSRTGTQGNLLVLIGFVHVAAQQNAEGPELAVFADGKEHVLRGTWHGEN